MKKKSYTLLSIASRDQKALVLLKQSIKNWKPKCRHTGKP
jgi:hypothetical protein